MNYDKFSTPALQVMHEAVHKAVQADKDAIARNETPSYGTHATEDWKHHARGIEAELHSRSVDFSPVVFPTELP